MKRFLKWLGYSLASVILLILFLFFIASIYVKQNKTELIAEASKTILEKYHSKVKIKDIHLSLLAQFPNLSIQLDEVDVEGPMFHLHHQKLFIAKDISVRIKTWPLFGGKIILSKTKLNKGQLFIYTDKLGNHNLDEFKQKEAAKKKSNFKIPENIELNDFNIIIKDDQKLKTFHFDIKSLNVKSKESDTLISLSIKKDLFVKSLIFNHLKGSFLKDQNLKGDYTIYLQKQKKILSFDPIGLTIGKTPFVLTGFFDLKKEGLFNLNIKTQGVPFEFAKSILTKNINKVLNQIIITQPLIINASIKGPLSGGEPNVIAQWQTKKTTIGTKQIQFRNADVEGMFNNQIDKKLEPNDANSSIVLSKLSGYWHDIAIQTSNIELNNLKYPHLKGGFKTQFNLSQLNPPLNTENIIIKNGKGKINIEYDGPLTEMTETNTKIIADLQISNAEIFVKPIQKSIINTHANIQVNNNTIEIKNLTAQTKEGSQITITGITTHSLAAIPNTPGKANIQLNINSPYLDLNNFSSSLKETKTVKRKNKKNTFSKIDHILENETININLDAKRIKWQNLIATNLKSSINLNTGNWALNNLSMNVGRGSILLSTKMAGKQNKKSITAKFQINKVRAEDLLYSMNNFGLKGLSYKNIRGELNINGQLSSPLNQLGGISPNQLKATLGFKLNDGALLNYAPLIKLQQSVFKKRHLDSLQFATIQNELTIENGNIHIPRMEIATSALNVFVGGDYGLDGKTNLHIQVPLNNITQRDQTKKMKTASNKERGGTSVFLKAVSDPSGKVKLTMDSKGGQYKREQMAQ